MEKYLLSRSWTPSSVDEPCNLTASNPQVNNHGHEEKGKIALREFQMLLRNRSREGFTGRYKRAQSALCVRARYEEDALTKFPSSSTARDLKCGLVVPVFAGVACSHKSDRSNPAPPENFP